MLLIIFVVNLTEYDAERVEPREKTLLDNRLMLFKKVVNSQWFWRTPVLQLFNHANAFKSALPKSPLGKYFPDYTGANDGIDAVQYIRKRFDQVFEQNNCTAS